MTNYTFLPFNFYTLNDKKLLVNQVGEYLFLENEEFCDFVEKSEKLTDSVYKKLKAKHFLTVEEELELAKELLATKLRTRKAFICESTNLHMIVITLRCNCLCKYCHASSVDLSVKSFDMDWDTAKKTIDMIFQSPSADIKIEYQGGEPLLNWSVLKESVLYAEFLNKIAKKRLGFVICTNLMQITKEQLLFCEKHKIELSTSLDGKKEAHDENRKSRVLESAYDSFKSNLPVVRKVLGGNGCEPLLTITKTNLNSLKKVIDHYVELGFSGVFLRALNPYGNAIKNENDLGYTCEEFLSAYKDALAYIVELNKAGTDFVEYYSTLFLSRIFTPFSTGFVDLQSPSGAGISGVIYNYDGKIYPADEARMLSRMGDDFFCMGNVFENSYEEVFNSKLLQSIVRNSCVETMTVCSECVYQQYCGADPIRNYLETGDLSGDRRTSGFCAKNKKILNHIFSLIEENDEKTMDIFWSWVTRRSYRQVNLERN